MEHASAPFMQRRLYYLQYISDHKQNNRRMAQAPCMSGKNCKSVPYAISPAIIALLARQ